MIRQICLNCYKTVELPDDTAGKDAACPNCGKMISVPPKYAAGVAEGGGLSTASPPAPPLPPTYSPGPKPGASKMSSDPSLPPGLKAESLPPPPPPADATASGLTHGFGFALSPTWLDWVPVGCILLAFLLTFFPWAEMKLGGYSVMTQNGWETVFASKGENIPKGPEWEKLDKGLAGKADDARYDAAVLRSDWLVLLYLLALMLLVVLLAAERVIRDPAAFPPTASMTFLPPLWKWRLAAIGGLAVVVFLLVCLQSFGGFSLQRSIDAFAKFDVKDKLATNPTEVEKRELWVKAGQISGAFAVHQTLWLNLLLVLHAVAVVALAARFWLDSRGAKPLPRFDARW